MQACKLPLFLVAALILAVTAPAFGEDPDESFLRAAKVPTDDAGLLVFLKQRSPDVEKLISQLADEDFNKREAASKGLAKLGLAAIPALRRAQNGRDREVARRAKACLQEMSWDHSWPLVRAVIRLLAKRESPESARALLEYLPFLGDEKAQEHLWFGMARRAEKDAHVRELLFKAVSDADPSRRAIAGCLLGRFGNSEQKRVARALLKDANPEVRLRTAQGLLGAKEEAGMPALIELLLEESTELGWQAEELLAWVAGDDAPRETVGPGDEISRKKCHQAWSQWYKPGVDFSKVEKDPRRPGLYFCCGTSRGKNRVWLCGCSGRIRWQLQELPRVSEVQLLPGNRFLAATVLDPPLPIGPPGGLAKANMQIVELDFLGKEHAQLAEIIISNFRRLPNGNTFIAQFPGAMEVSAKGEEILGVDYGHIGAYSRTLLENGRIFALDYRNKEGLTKSLLEYDPWKKREMRKVVLEKPGRIGLARDGNVRLLPNGNYLFDGLEIDGAGKVVWRSPFKDWPADLLPNGNLIYARRELPHLIETDRKGRVLWEACDVEELSSHESCAHSCFSLLRVGTDWPRPKNLDLSSVESRRRGLRHQDQAVRLVAALGLERLKEESAPATGDLIKTLEDADDTLRDTIGRALKVVGPKGVPELIRGASHERAEVRSAAVFALAQGGEEAIPVLAEALKDKDTRVRAAAVPALGAIYKRKADKAIIPLIVRSFDDDDKLVRMRAAGFFCDNPDRAFTEIVPPLLKWIPGNDVELRNCAFSALTVNAGAKNDAALKALVGLLKSKDPAIQRHAAWSLGWIGAEESIPALTEIAGDKAWPADDRRKAIEMLSEMNVKSKAFISLLEEAQKDLDDRLKARASAALAKIRATREKQ